MMNFQTLPKLTKGDKVAIVSPSFAAPAVWPHIYQLGLERLKTLFGLVPVEYPTTKQLGASTHDRAEDLISAFSDSSIKAVISTIGGDDQVTYIKNLPSEPFVSNPKPFFGFSDNTHFINFLWLHGIPAFYGGAIFTQFAEEGKMNDYTIKYLQKALFESGIVEIFPSDTYNDIGFDWNNKNSITQKRVYEKNKGWQWEGNTSAEGILWGGCVESIDEMLRHGISLPEFNEFEQCVLVTETSEEMPSAAYVSRVFRALGERGILAKIKAVLVGRAKAWEFHQPRTSKEKIVYSNEQQTAIVTTVRQYNLTCPIVQNLDFGHTSPQIPLPMGRKAVIDNEKKKIFLEF